MGNLLKASRIELHFSSANGHVNEMGSLVLFVSPTPFIRLPFPSYFISAFHLHWAKIKSNEIEQHFNKLMKSLLI